MSGVLPAEHVAGVFNHRVLKAAAGAEERNAVFFPGIADRGKRAFRVTIRAAGNDPDGIVLSASPEAIDEVVSQSYFTGCSSTAAASSIAREWPDGQQYRGDNRRQGRGVKEGFHSGFLMSGRDGR